MKIIKEYILFIVKHISVFFFESKYVSGRHFEKNGEGWTWVAKGIWRQKILGFNRFVPWPMQHTSTISNCKNIEFHIDDLNNFQSPGCYFQNFSAKIILGKGTYIGPNVGLITANHDFYNLQTHKKGKNITFGKDCWIGMNSVVLPGVVLGDNTIVGAGSIVSKSFVKGNVVIAGNPAKIIKEINT